MDENTVSGRNSEGTHKREGMTVICRRVVVTMREIVYGRSVRDVRLRICCGDGKIRLLFLQSPLGPISHEKQIAFGITYERTTMYSHIQLLRHGYRRVAYHLCSFALTAMKTNNLLNCHIICTWCCRIRHASEVAIPLRQMASNFLSTG